MGEIILKSYGKINLGLDILYKRKDNYHEINTIMQQIDLHDIVTIRDREKDIKLESDHKDLPLDSNNLVYKAWQKLGEKTGIYKGVEIIIEKHIPIAAGLAGGSTNAATVLKGLNELWNLKLSDDELKKIGVEIGADVAFCIVGGTAKAQGIGEKLTKLKAFKDVDILLINPGTRISTKEVYENLNLNINKRIDIDKIIDFMEKEDIKSVSENMENIMEEFVINKNPIIKEIKRDMLDFGALGSLMSGSGATVFGIFDNKERLNSACENLKDKYKTVIISKTI